MFTLDLKIKSKTQAVQQIEYSYSRTTAVICSIRSPSRFHCLSSLGFSLPTDFGSTSRRSLTHSVANIIPGVDFSPSLPHGPYECNLEHTYGHPRLHLNAEQLVYRLPVVRSDFIFST